MTVVLVAGLLWLGCFGRMEAVRSVFEAYLPMRGTPSPEMEETSPVAEETLAKTITLSFVGDCMLGSPYGSSGWWTLNLFAQEQDPDYFFRGVYDILAADDWTIANCEGVFTDQKLPEAPKSGKPAYWYRGPSSNAEIFKAGSVEIVSVANNHVMDYGVRGRDDTEAALTQAGIMFGGDQKPLILEKYGIRIGLYCCTMYTYDYATRIAKWLEEVRDETDYRIVYYHGGTERVYEIDAWRELATQKLIDAGASLVIGNHPHVVQPIKTVRGVEVVGSLGNFIFGGSRMTDNRTMIYQKVLHIWNGKIQSESSKVIPCYEYIAGSNLMSNWQPRVMAEDDPNHALLLSFLRGEIPTPRG